MESLAKVRRKPTPNAAKRPSVAAPGVRIVGGAYRGRKLAVPKDGSVRPTGDRVRESLFNMLEHLGDGGWALVGATVLDRFAGSGALGLEALSRGAAEVWLIERSAATRRLIAANASALGGHDDALAARVRIDDEGALAGGPAFDLLLCDPPYGFAKWAELVSGFERARIVKPGSRLVIESDAADPVPDFTPPWVCEKDRRLGRSRVQIWRRADGRAG